MFSGTNRTHFFATLYFNMFSLEMFTDFDFHTCLLMLTSLQYIALSNAVETTVWGQTTGERTPMVGGQQPVKGECNFYSSTILVLHPSFESTIRSSSLNVSACSFQSLS